MNSRLSIMTIFAHPDDEAFGVAGSLTKYSREGVATAVVAATRGEVGTIFNPAAATEENLPQVRERELRRACQIMGVREVRFLGYRDGDLENCQFEEAVGKIVQVIRELKPTVIITFGPDGVTGHHDHITIGRLATAAFSAAGDESAYPEQLKDGLLPHSPKKLYHVAPSRSRFRAMRQKMIELGMAAPADELEREDFGVPDEAITTRIDISAYAQEKLNAILSHDSQIALDSPFRRSPQELAPFFFSQEQFTRVVPPPANPVRDETDLLAGLR